MRLLIVMMAAACGGSQRDAITWSTPVEISAGGGERGAWQQNNSRYDYVDDPSVVLAPDGDALVAWVDHRHKDVFWQRFTPDSRAQLAAPLNVSRSAAVFSWLPRVALSPHDPQHVYIVWQEIVFSGGTHGGEIFFARSRDGGRTVDPARNLSSSIEGDGKGRLDAKRWHNGSLDLAIGADGTIYVAWTAYEGNLELRRSRDGGTTFDDAVTVVAASPTPARAPALAVGPAGVHLAWTTGEDDHADIHVATAADGAAFGEPVIVERTPGYSDAPKLAVDASGTLHLAFAESRGGPFDRAEVRYTRSRDGKQFEPPRTISPPHTGDVAAAFPAIAVANQRIFVSWEHYPRGEQLPRGLGLAYSLDGGTTFSRPRVIEATVDRGDNGSLEGRLMRKLAVRGDAIAVVNSAVRRGESSRVWLVRGRLR